MANFTPTLPAENFVGAPGVRDTVDYSVNATGGVTVDVVNGGSRDIAEGDTYVSIDRFFLTNIGTEIDYFYGSSADEVVRGYAGPNVLYGNGGDDVLFGGDDRNVLNGGTGVDLLIGGNGDDRFDIAAGDAAAGELYRGNAGFDTIRLISGGTGTEVDLTGATLLSIEEIAFAASVTLILDSDDLLLTDIQGTSADGEIVRVADWSFLAGNVELDRAFALIDSGVDEVQWTRGNNTGDITLTEEVIDLDSGETAYVETFVNDGSANIGVDSLVTYYNQDFNQFQTIRTMDDGLQVTTQYDPNTGTTLEEFYFDLSPTGTTYDFEFRSVQYNSIGTLEYRITQYDNDLLEEQVYDADGNITLQYLYDASSDGSAFSFMGIEEFYEFDGTSNVLRYRFTMNDATESFVTVSEFFDETGAFDYSESVRANGVVSISGSSADQVFYATDATEVISGLRGTDTFVFEGNVGDTFINAFDRIDSDLLDLTAFGIESRDDLEAAGAVTYDAAGSQHIIDVSLIGGDGMIYLRGTVDTDLGNDDFILL